MSLHVQPKSRFPVAPALPHGIVRSMLCAVLAFATAASAQTVPQPAVTWHGPHTARLDPAVTRLSASLMRAGYAQAARDLVLDVTIQPTRAETVAGYAIVIDKGRIRIISEGENAALDALAFLGLLATPDGFENQTLHATPLKFPRTLTLDLASKAAPLTMRDIEVQIDAARLLGLDSIRLNLVGANGFAVESQRYPWLAGPSPRLRQAQIRALVDYARLRGIVFVPRINLAALPSATLARSPDLGKSTFDVGHAAARQFLFVLDGEMARLFAAPVVETGHSLPVAVLAALNDRLARTNIAAHADTPTTSLTALSHIGRPAAHDIMRADALWNGRIGGTPSARAAAIATILKAGPLE